MVFPEIGTLGIVCLTLTIGCSDPCNVPTPNIVTQPLSQTRVEGESVTLRVGLADKSEIAQYQWQKNGVNFAIGQNFYGDLVISPLAPSDAGTYTVIVTYSRSGDCSAQRSATSEPAVLTVNPKPSSSISRKVFSESVHESDPVRSPA